MNPETIGSLFKLATPLFLLAAATMVVTKSRTEFDSGSEHPFRLDPDASKTKCNERLSRWMNLLPVEAILFAKLASLALGVSVSNLRNRLHATSVARGKWNSHRHCSNALEPVGLPPLP